MSVLNPITFVTGTLGSGKSYFANRYVFEYLKQGKTVATNFDLVGPWWATVAQKRHPGIERLRKVQRRLGRLLGPSKGYSYYEEYQEIMNLAWRFDKQDQLYDFRLPGEGEDRGLLVLDEQALQLNSRLYRERQKADKDRYGSSIKSLEFYINMRKLGWTCLILAHSQDMIDNQVRALGGGIVRLRNFNRVKMPLIGVPLTKNPRFLAIHIWPEVGAVVKRELYGLDMSIAQHYRSMETFAADPEETGLRRHRDPGPLAQVLVHPDLPGEDGRDGEELGSRRRGRSLLGGGMEKAG